MAVARFAVLAACAAPVAGSAFGCQSPGCVVRCADCAPNPEDAMRTCAPHTENCGTSSPTDQWSDGGSVGPVTWDGSQVLGTQNCLQYAKFDDGTPGNQCDGEALMITGSYVIGIMAFITGFLICCIYPIARCCCNCCGGNTVNTESLCKGQEGSCGDNCSATPALDMRAKELASAAHPETGYFNSKGLPSMINPLHPTGARFCMPALTMVFVILGMSVGISGATQWGDASDDFYDAFLQVITNVLDTPINQIDTNLQGINSCRICNAGSATGTTYTYSGPLAAAVTGIKDTAANARRQVHDLRDDAEKVSGAVKAAVIALAVIPVPAAIALLAMAVLRCGRLSQGMCGGGCLVHLQTFGLILPLFILLAILVTITSVVHVFTDEICKDIHDMGASPPNLRGIVVNDPNGLGKVCQDFSPYTAQMFTALEAQRTPVAPTCGPQGQAAYSQCQPFQDAMDMLRGRPQRYAAGQLLAGQRGGIYEGMVNCRRMLYETGKAISPVCTDLTEGTEKLLAGMWLGLFAMLFALVSILFGYKRWINEEDLAGANLPSTEPTADIVQAVPIPPTDDNVKPMVVPHCGTVVPETAPEK